MGTRMPGSRGLPVSVHLLDESKSCFMTTITLRVGWKILTITYHNTNPFWKPYNISYSLINCRKQEENYENIEKQWMRLKRNLHKNWKTSALTVKLFSVTKHTSFGIYFPTLKKAFLNICDIS